MEEQNEQAVQNEPVEQTGDSSRPESISVADAVREAPEIEPSTPIDREGGDDTEQKPQTRLERRVDTLVDKLKQANQQQVDPNQLFGNEELFTKEERESGVFDPNVFQQRLQQREQKVQALAAQQAVQAVEYKSKVSEHISDMDVVKEELGNDPVLDELVSRQYDALNHQTDPRTGMRVFVPQVKMSDIYKDFKKMIDAKSTQAAASIQNRVAEQANDQAVPVSVSQAPSTDFESQETFDKATKTGQIEDWAAVLKKRMKS